MKIPRRFTLHFSDKVEDIPTSNRFRGKLKHYLFIAGMALFLWFMAFALPLGFLI